MMDRRKAKSKKIFILCLVGVGVVCFVVGILIGYFSRARRGASGTSFGPDVPSKIVSDGEEHISQTIIDLVNAENIRENLQEYTSHTHVAGTPGDERLAQKLFDTWEAQGLDHVTKSTYDVLLSHPDESDPSVIRVIDISAGSDVIVFESQTSEKLLRDAASEHDPFPIYNAYAPPGDVEGEVVFLNYGTTLDREYVQQNASIDLTGKILLCKLGMIFWGELARFAHSEGSLGVIFFTDPADFTSAADRRVYPDAWWLPPTGVHRGSLYTGTGDPLTPGYPATASAYRWDEAQLQTLPRIPTHPIGYGDAEQLLRLMGGAEAPDAWRSGINVTHRLGPGFQNSALKLKMHMTARNKRVNSTNVFGYITGSVEPDRYVLLGNHRDAWAFGAVDPSTGTAIMMELSRVLASLLSTGWRPRRTIVFCSWGAEEFGIIGSYEWVEEHAETLRRRAVAYLNMDMAVRGNFSLRGAAAPGLRHAVAAAAHKIDTPNEAGKTLYEEWSEKQPMKDDEGTPLGTPQIRPVLGIGSDYVPFVVLSGTPSASVIYTFDPGLRVVSYPLYHSAYDSFHVVDSFIDPGFKHSRAVGQCYGELLRDLADSLLLPINVSAYGELLGEYTANLRENYGKQMDANGVSLGSLDAAIEEFRTAAETFTSRRNSVNTLNPMATRTYNDQMMMLEQHFLSPSGLPSDPLHKHLLFSPTADWSLVGSSFPGLVDLVTDADETPDPAPEWEKVKQHLSAIVFAIHSAADSLVSSEANGYEI